MQLLHTRRAYAPVKQQRPDQQIDIATKTLFAVHAFGAPETGSMKDAFDLVAGMCKQIRSITSLFTNNTDRSSWRSAVNKIYCHGVTTLLKDKEHRTSSTKTQASFEKETRSLPCLTTPYHTVPHQTVPDRTRPHHTTIEIAELSRQPSY